MIAALCLTGCSKESEEEVPVETKPAIVTKNEDLGGTKTGNEEEIEEAENALKRGIVSFYANDVESFVASTDVDVLYAMMYGKALNQAEKTEFVASLKERLPVPVYDEYNKQKIVDYTLKEAPNERIYDEGTKKLRSLDWLSDLTFQIPTNVAVEVDFDKIEYISKGQENDIWSFFQGDRELDYIQKSAVMISEPKDNYEIDKIYEIPYTLVTDEELEEFYAEHPKEDNRPDSQIPEGMSQEEYLEAMGVSINEFGEIIRPRNAELDKDLIDWLNGGQSSPLKKREEQLSKLETEAKTISEAEALIDKQNAKEGQNIGE